jgi:hypothetical protein
LAGFSVERTLLSAAVAFAFGFAFAFDFSNENGPRSCDLIEAGYEPGPSLKEILTAVEDAQLEGSPSNACLFHHIQPVSAITDFPARPVRQCL